MILHICGSKTFKEPRYNCVILEGIVAEICVQTHAKFKWFHIPKLIHQEFLSQSKTTSNYVKWEHRVYLWQWAEKSFEDLKEYLIQYFVLYPVVELFNEAYPTELHSDASGVIQCISESSKKLLVYIKGMTFRRTL